jgi:outer membrane protein insertion porin family
MIYLRIFLILFFAVKIPFAQDTISIVQDTNSIVKDANIVIDGAPQKLVFDYSSPREYEIGGILITGTEHLDHAAVRLLSGLTIGDKIQVPGNEITDGIKKLWQQGLFSDVKIYVTRTEGDYIFLEIALHQKPRLSKFSFQGISKSDADNLREKLHIEKGDVVNDHLLMTTSNIIKNYFVDKGFLNSEVSFEQKKDTAEQNQVILDIQIKKNKKIKIHDIIILGNTSALSSSKIRRAMKNTKERGIRTIFSSSKYMEKDYEEDKLNIIAKYNNLGYRDAKIVADSVFNYSENQVNIYIQINEGRKYYFRNIEWIGNAKYNDTVLTNILGIHKGDAYNQSQLDKRLFMDPNGNDISSLYLDDGYLFFSVNPVESYAGNDSIDLEMRVYEGPQARINKIIVSGNTKTNDHVILREIRTRPGDLFRRSDVIRSQRELAQLGYFDPEQMQVNPTPNPANGTVDIEYVVSEKPSDQLELSGGIGGSTVVGTLGVSFTNFSLRNIFNPKAYQPLPSGDGQRLTLRGQSYGIRAQSLTFSFVEPWLGGKKPNSLSTSVSYTVQRTGTDKEADDYGTFNIISTAVGWGTRLKKPDDYFTFYSELSYQKFLLNNFGSYYGATFPFSDGSSNIITLKGTLGRSSIDQPIYPRTGSKFSFSLDVTPPYSFVNNSILNKNIDYSAMEVADKYKWIEYHKWKFEGGWFTPIWKNLVLYNQAKFGFLGAYNATIGASPFERFYLGGADMLNQYNFTGSEWVDLRGYEQGSLSPSSGSIVYNTFTTEVRYPISLNPQATIFLKAFAEGGNAWDGMSEYNPFSLKRSAGLGVSLYMPMFGLIEVNWGYAFDIEGLNRTQPFVFHFRIGGLQF